MTNEFISFKFFLLQSKRTISIQLSVLELSKKNIHCTHLHDFYEFCRPGNPIPWYFQVFHAWGTLLGSDSCLDCYILPWMHFDSITFISYMMCITACCGTTWSGKLVFVSRVLYSTSLCWYNTVLLSQSEIHQKKCLMQLFAQACK